ncbi:MAG: hypothetical protein V3U53_06865 [bacterium]
MTSPGTLFVRELIQVTAADILLLTLVTFFFLSGLAYKIKAARDARRTRTSIRNLKGAVQEYADQEKRFKVELQQLMHTQNANMSEITRLRRKKADLGSLPTKLEEELEELVSWCRERSISVDFDRRVASRRPIRRNKPS